MGKKRTSPKVLYKKKINLKILKKKQEKKHFHVFIFLN